MDSPLTQTIRHHAQENRDRIAVLIRHGQVGLAISLKSPNRN